MTSPDHTPHEEIRNSLREPIRQEVISSLQFDALKEAALTALPPEEEGIERAHIIMECPISNEGWHEVGVRASTLENAYSSILLSTIANSARNPDVATPMVAVLGANTQQLSQRISPRLAMTIVVRTLNTATAHPDAIANIIPWATSLIPNIAHNDYQEDLFTYTSYDALTALLPFFEELERSDLSSMARAKITAIETYQHKKLHEQKQKEEARAAETTRRQALQERQNYIRDNALQTFTHICTSRGVTSETIAESVLDDPHVWELLMAANCLTVQYGQRELSLQGNGHLFDLAHSVLDKALQLKREGADFDDVGHALSAHEERRVTSAPSLANFKEELTELAKWRDLTPVQMGTLYETWRHYFAIANQQEKAGQTLRELGIDPHTEFRPEGIDMLEVTTSEGWIVYERDAIDELLSDMREYFTPQIMPLIREVVATSGRERSEKEYKMGAFFDFDSDEDREIMARLEQEIREWATSDDARPYSCHIPKYEGRSFDDQIIRIGKDKQGRFLFNLRGGYNRPTEIIDSFAAFTTANKEVTYGGRIKLTYRAEPPTEFIKTTTQRFRGENTSTEEAIEVSLPVAAILQQIKDLTMLDSTALDRLWSIAQRPYEGPEQQGIQIGQTFIGAETTTIREEQPSLDGQRLVGKAIIHERHRHEENRRFSLPCLSITLQIEDPQLEATFARLFHAIGIHTQYGGRKRYTNGFVGGHNIFHPNVQI